MDTLPRPSGQPYAGHLPRWAGEPLALLEEGAALGSLFALSLGVPAVVGFSPEWNRQLLGDLDTFRSGGSFSRLVPHLAGGVILLDAPGHRSRRAHLNVPFSAASLASLRERLRVLLHHLRPEGEFDALRWADDTTLHLLNAAYFSGEFPVPLLRAFLAPLRRPFPAPMLPRPALFARASAEITRLACRRRAEGGTDLLAHLARLEGHVEETRVTLAAAHDTTTHTLAWAVWHLAHHPEWRTREGLRPVVRETLRLTPPGFIGSRRLGREVEFGGHRLTRGTLALYSPYLTHRDPDLWARPLAFDPARFGRPPAAWSYLPFGGGERTCLGMHLAHLLLDESLSALLGGELKPVRGNATLRPGVTLGPTGPLVVAYRGR
ncbi:cytochrome P450 [Deinococcus hopiensis]|uniref:Cytochrome P450 n=1 Tax=Deinococcus hopiensis KR-140 TaxID=695939 RepID=A0A1W1UF89_9DEIO|nr:cytochrome P450 [Deinococcus hopiensis]SMB79730.1 Cytochrome P450 [Deinococcus hopiensis KR-140]